MLTRQQWGARAPKETPTPVSIKARSGFCTHYDGATPIVLRTLDDAIAQVRKDQDFHMDGRGWNDIGYNFLVVSAPGTPVDGLLVEGRGRDVVGAHCENHNTAWVGVQVAIGGDQQPSPAALATVRKLYDDCSAAHGSSLGKFGHRDGFNTACPGPLLYAWVQAGMPSTTPTSAQEDDMFTDADRALLQQALTKADGNTIRRDLGSIRDQIRGDLSKMSAQQVADSIPDNLAQQVVDLLAARLKGA